MGRRNSQMCMQTVQLLKHLHTLKLDVYISVVFTMNDNTRSDNYLASAFINGKQNNSNWNWRDAPVSLITPHFPFLLEPITGHNTLLPLALIFFYVIQLQGKLKRKAVSNVRLRTPITA